MDSIRVPKVEHVSCTKAGATASGTLHLTAHHLIFRYDDETKEEMWVPYPLISLVNRLPQTFQGQWPLTLHMRTFETFSMTFINEMDSFNVFESVKELTVAPSIYQLYAFFYSPNPPLPTSSGWNLYSPRDEFGRMGIGTRTKAWRFTDINKDYSFCSTYPARLVVPTRISDTTLQYASKYRSKARIPALTYLHWNNYGSITRSSQPMVGFTQNRSIQDEKLIEAVFQSHYNPESRASNIQVYGATATNLIIDARPTANAVANTAKGAGTENMDHYKEARKLYLGIDHIHAMRDSLGKVVEALREADAMLANINNDLGGDGAKVSVLDRQALRRSGWLRHISAIIEGSVIIAKNVHVNSSHVLIHCSDGWDRTSQLSALSQLCLDPFYRTIRGFQILVEKDWLSFGHKFLDRCGHLSSDKFFISTTEQANPGSGAEAAQAFLASMQNRFASQHHVKETSPVFHQFLESVRQIQRQFPARFEFNERFLRQLYHHLYSCQFGTFLFNSEQERRVGENNGGAPCERTVSVWDFLNSPSEMEQNLNPLFDPSLDNPTSREASADMGVLMPNPKNVRFWNELYGRTDEEMNGRVVVAQARGVDVVGPIDDAAEDVAVPDDIPTAVPLPPSPSKTPVNAPPVSHVKQEDSQVRVNTSSSSSPRGRPSPIPRSDSFKPFEATSSTFSLKSAVVDAPSSPSPSPSPLKAGLKAPDFLSNSNVRSVWGRLSSNATAAFSAVQGAYEGVARDFKGLSTGDSPDKFKELTPKESLSGWGEETNVGPPERRQLTPTPLPSSSNPWANTGSNSDTFSQYDNPWNSGNSVLKEDKPLPSIDDNLKSQEVKSPNTYSASVLSELQAVSVPSTAANTLSESSPRRAADRQERTESPAAPASQNTDPLGVGFL